MDFPDDDLSVYELCSLAYVSFDKLKDSNDSEEVHKALELLHEVQRRASSEQLISSNEFIEDFEARDMAFLSLPFMEAQLVERSGNVREAEIDHNERLRRRMRCVSSAVEVYSAFLSR